MTDARVEPRAGRVVAGARAWSFALDCRTGAASLALGEGPLRVRPLRWREKAVLARFAFMGEAFVEEQTLQLALEGAPAPDGDERAAAAALARWLNDPDDTAAMLPLRGQVLAAVTLEVCASVGLRPSDLDDRDAAEVEALWRAAGAARPATAPAAVKRAAALPAAAPPNAGETVEVGEATTIVIVPDPIPVPAVEPAAAEEPDAQPAIRSFRPVEYVPIPNGAPPEPLRARLVPAGSNGHARSERVPTRPGDVAEARSHPHDARDLSGIERSVLSAQTTGGGIEGEAVPQEETGRPGAVADAVGSMTARRTAVAAAPRTHARATRPRAARVERAPAIVEEQPAPRARPVAAPAAQVDHDALLDELSDRLARAAADLGVAEV